MFSLSYHEIIEDEKICAAMDKNKPCNYVADIYENGRFKYVVSIAYRPAIKDNPFIYESFNYKTLRGAIRGLNSYCGSNLKIKDFKKIY